MTCHVSCDRCALRQEPPLQNPASATPRPPGMRRRNWQFRSAPQLRTRHRQVARIRQGGDAPTSESGSALRWLGSLLRSRQHQAHQPFRPRAPPLHQVQHCCGNTAMAQLTWGNTRAPAASTAPDTLPTRHYLPQAAKPRVASNATWPGTRTMLSRARRPADTPPRGQSVHEQQSPAPLCLPAAVGRLQHRHPVPAAHSDLDPDTLAAGRHCHRHQAARDSRATVPQAIGHQLACQQERYARPSPPGSEPALRDARNPAPQPCPAACLPEASSPATLESYAAWADVDRRLAALPPTVV
jgi:hypothetical protein